MTLPIPERSTTFGFKVNNNNNNNLIYVAPACRMTSEALADSSLKFLNFTILTFLKIVKIRKSSLG